MTITLFEFEEDQDISEVKAKELFEVLRKEFKDANNPFCKRISASSMISERYLQYFEEQGWIKLSRHSSSIELVHEYVDFYTPEEVVDKYQELMEELLKRPNICWYSDVLQLRNNHGTPRFESDEERDRYYKLKSEITKQASIKLGLDHFLKVPSSRGHKTSVFSSKWSKANVLPELARHVISKSNYDEMSAFFRNHIFFFGRSDWDNSSSNFRTPPYPVFKAFHPTEFELACLSEANDQKTVALIFEYLSSVEGRGIHKDNSIIYPQGWSIEKYRESLSAEDIELLYSDVERLDRLHNGRILKGRTI